MAQISLGPTCNGFDAFDEDEEEEADKTQQGSMSSRLLCTAQRKCLDSRALQALTKKGEETVRKGGRAHSSLRHQREATSLNLGI